MPLFEDETYAQSIFRIAYPDVVAALEAGFGNPGTRSAWTTNHEISPISAEAMRNDIATDALRYPDDPAMAWDCPNIPNGRYVLEDMDGTQWDFSIHLVQSGSLSGKRIVRYKFGGSTYKGFAWLTRSGHLKVWTRYASDERRGERYITLAGVLIDALRTQERDRILTTSEQSSWFLAYNRGTVSVNYQIHPQVRCFICSEPCRNESEHRAQCCAAHMPVQREDPAIRRQRAIEEQQSRAEVERVRREQAQRDAVTRAAQRRESRRAARATQNAYVPGQGRTAALPRCEVTGVEVQ